MKKTMALLMAMVILVSAGMTNVLAASTNAVFKLDLSSARAENVTEEPARPKLEAGKASLTLQTSSGDAITFKNKKTINTGDGSVALAAAFAGAESEMRYNGSAFTVKLTQVKLDSGSSDGLEATVYPAGTLPFSFTGASLAPAGGTNNASLNLKGGVSVKTKSAGSGGTFDPSNQTIDIRQVLYSDANGRAVPLVESKSDLNGTGDGVRSGSDVYFLVNAPFDNDNYFKLRVTKGKNSKNIDKMEVKSKYYTKELYKVYGGQQVASGLTTGRHTFIKVPLKEIYTDDEYKITFDLKVSLTSDGEKKYPNYKETSIKADDVTAIYLKNKEVKGDGDYRVGEKGMVVKPLSNDWNEIVWYNEARDLARLYFFADSDVKAFYSKLSTKWDHMDYASYFNDQDAYIFDFTGSPKISSTSRADLEIYNPFLNSDGKETTNPKNITIYQVVDGDLHDVTSQWSYDEGDNGEMAYKTRTRFLGTYIFCEKPVKEAVDKDKDNFKPDTYPGGNHTPELPPEVDPGAKKPANTGRYED